MNANRNAKRIGLMNLLHEPKTKTLPEATRLVGTDFSSAAHPADGKPLLLRNQIRPPDKDQAGKRKPTAHREVKSYKAIYAIDEDLPKIKTLDLRLTNTDGDLGSEIKKAFELAKIAGQELNLVFSQTTY